MKSVRELLQAKGYGVGSIGPDASVCDALQLMADKHVGALLVLDAGKLVGILSERDYARKVILRGKASKTTPVREIMTAQVVRAQVDESIEEAMVLMTNKRIRHLPVLDGERLVGVVSIGDAVKAIALNGKQTFHLNSSSISSQRFSARFCSGGCGAAGRAGR
jgi:CBS domain-containing protein